MKNQSAQQRYEVTMRVNRDLLEELRRLASRDNRSINSYLTALLHKELQRERQRNAYHGN